MHKGAQSTDAMQVRGRIARAMQVLGGGVAAAGWLMQATGDAGPGGAGMLVFITGWAMAGLSWTFFGAFEKLALVRLIQDLPTSKIRSAPQGYVELRGMVRWVGETIECPLCHKRCLWFQYDSGGKNSKRYVPTGRTPDIVLDDGTGRCRVVAHNSELVSARRGEGPHAHICVGDPLHVLGEFRTPTEPRPSPAMGRPYELQAEGAPARSRQEALHRKLLALKYDARRMGVFDVNRDGRLDEREVEAAWRTLQRQVEKEPQASTPPPRPDSVIQKPASDADRLPFVIFVGHEHNAIRATRMEIVKRAVLTVVVGLFAGVFALQALDGSERRADRQARRSERAAAAAAPRPAEPERKRTPRQQAFDLHRAGRLDEAIAAYDALLQQDAADAELHFWRAAAHGRLGHEDQALADVTRSCELGKPEGCEMAERLARQRPAR